MAAENYTGGYSLQLGAWRIQSAFYSIPLRFWLRRSARGNGTARDVAGRNGHNRLQFQSDRAIDLILSSDQTYSRFLTGAVDLLWQGRKAMRFLKRISLPFVLLMGLAACAAPGPLPGATSLEKAYQSSIRGNWGESINASTEAIKIARDEEIFFYSYSSRCEFRIWQGQYDAALEDCNDSIRALPDFYGDPYAARARIFAVKGQYGWAIEEFDAAIDLGGTRFVPGGNNPRVIAYGGKARVFATSTDQRFRNEEMAVKFAEKAVGLEKGLNTPAYKILNRDTLAAAYAAAGRFDDAVKEQKKTIAMLKDNGWAAVTYNNESLLEILNKHLRQFEERKPLRGGIY